MAAVIYHMYRVFYNFYAEGVYKYTNKDNIMKTVRRVNLISR